MDLKGRVLDVSGQDIGSRSRAGLFSKSLHDGFKLGTVYTFTSVELFFQDLAVAFGRPRTACSQETGDVTVGRGHEFLLTLYPLLCSTFGRKRSAP